MSRKATARGWSRCVLLSRQGVLGALSLTVATLACSPAPPSLLAGENVILVVVDTLRADHLGCYGYERTTSPFIDSLASRAVLFEDVTSASSHTVPSVISLWSAVYPHRHGNQYFPHTNSFRAPRKRVRPHVPDSLRLLSEYLGSAGYRTAAVVTNPWMQPRYGFARGFDDYRFLHNARWTDHQGAARVNEVARGLLEEWGDAPFFLYLHYMDVHGPYEPPGAYREQFTGGSRGSDVYRNGPLPDAKPLDVGFTRALYDGGIRGFDDELRALVSHLAARGILESTLLVFAADHGEEFHEHGGMGHGWTLYEEVTRTPLFFVHPALGAAGRRVSGPVSTVDILPTLLELVGADVPSGLDGISLAPWILDPSLDRRPPLRPLLSELGTQLAIRRGNHKLIQARDQTGAEAFDLHLDRGEQRPLGDVSWRSRLEQEMERLIRPDAGEDLAPKEAIAEKEERAFQERLRALGYVE